MTKPAQQKVHDLIRAQSLIIAQGSLWAGPIQLADLAVARAAGVDRRIVRAVIKYLTSSAVITREAP